MSHALIISLSEKRKRERVVRGRITMILAGILSVFYFGINAHAMPADKVVEVPGYVEAQNESYIIDGNGRIYYQDTANTVYTGIGDDGYIYDNNGEQKNTLTYIRNKYQPIYEQTAVDEEVLFESLGDARLFILSFMMENPYQIGQSYTCRQKAKESTVYIPKKMFEDKKVEMGPEYDLFITTTVASIKALPTFQERVDTANKIVASYFSYDINYAQFSLKEAFRDRKAVCYHYASLLHTILTAAGIDSEYMVGMYNQTEFHAWNRVYNPEQDCYLYLDATHLSNRLPHEKNLEISYQRYLIHYTMVDLNYYQ